MVSGLRNASERSSRTSVTCGSARDKEGLPVAGCTQHRKIAWIVTGAAIVLSIAISAAMAGVASNTAAQLAPAASDAGTDAAADEPTAEQPAVEEPAAESVPETAAVERWADETYGSFEPVTATGAGDNLVTLPVGATAGLVTAQYGGTGNFSIAVLNGSNESTGELLVNTIGAYSGTSAYGFQSFSAGVTLQVSADADWSITITPVSTAATLSTSGTGDGVYLFDGPTGQLTATYSGAGNFVIFEETGEDFNFGLLISEIGAYSGTVPLSGGPSVITVTADAPWTLEAK